MGMLIYDAIMSRDYALLQGASYIIILMTAISVFIVDLAYPFIDPAFPYRVRVELMRSFKKQQHHRANLMFGILLGLI